jgi:hypothetical protein
MTTKLLVMNDALRLLGEQPLSDPNDLRLAGVTLRDAWNGALLASLETGTWNTFHKRAALAQLPVPPVFGWRYAYQLPNDHLRTIFITDLPHVTDSTPSGSWKDENGAILSNAANLYICYISTDNIARFGDWDQVFADLVAAELAMRCQPTLNSSSEVADRIERKFKERRSQAKAFDAMKNPPQRLPPGRFRNARLGFGVSRMNDGEQG